jgi:hypothetical protein
MTATPDPARATRPRDGPERRPGSWHPRIIWTEPMDAALIALRRQGYHWQIIGDRIGVDDATARRRARKLGIPTGRLSIGSITGPEVIAGAAPPRRPMRCLGGRRVKGLSPRWHIEATPP